MHRESAHILALQALAFVAADEDLLGALLAQTGLSPQDLRRRAGAPELLASVADFLMAEDARVLAFAAAAGVKPEMVARMRAALPGGDAPDWT